ncbi:ATP/GTP-binding protein [Streptomyces sp. WM6378]|uniref:ATP/GTP-binding protein n=1 Tax=Streptomyces sp. WM6378 TaxID=1415557 RepID=UPI001F3467B4|nr:ATP/GTP-binding protein [Streptomyces sp. WM6378]
MADHEGHDARRPALLKPFPLVLTLGLALTALPAVAQADDDPVVGGTCGGMRLYVTACAQSPGQGGGGETAQKTSTGSEATESSNAPKCSTEKMDPQPPADNLGWEGHKPGDGAVYRIWCDTGRTGVIWAGDAPAAQAVDPEVLARQAVDRMKLTGPDININPKPGGKGLVGMPVWLAVNQSPTTYGPNSATATAGGVTVTAAAQVSRIDWAMGDGQHVVCNGPGKPYKKEYGLATSDCGYVYPQPSTRLPGGAYPVTATATWNVTWQVTGGGAQNGQFTQTRQSSVQVTIVESQAVNQ